MHFAIYDLKNGKIAQTGTTNGTDQYLCCDSTQGLLILENAVSADQFYVNVNDKTLVKFPDKPMNIAVWDWHLRCWQTPAEVEAAKSKKWKEAKESRNLAATGVLTRVRNEYYAQLNTIYDSIADIRQQIARAKTVSEVESVSCKI